MRTWTARSIPNHDDLVFLKELVETGKLTPVIDRAYLLYETAAELSYVEAGHTRGKVVATVQGWAPAPASQCAKAARNIAKLKRKAIKAPDFDAVPHKPGYLN